MQDWYFCRINTFLQVYRDTEALRIRGISGNLVGRLKANDYAEAMDKAAAAVNDYMELYDEYKQLQKRVGEMGADGEAERQMREIGKRIAEAVRKHENTNDDE